MGRETIFLDGQTGVQIGHPSKLLREEHGGNVIGQTSETQTGNGPRN